MYVNQHVASSSILLSVNQTCDVPGFNCSPFRKRMYIVGFCLDLASSDVSFHLVPQMSVGFRSGKLAGHSMQLTPYRQGTMMLHAPMWERIFVHDEKIFTMFIALCFEIIFYTKITQTFFSKKTLVLWNVFVVGKLHFVSDPCWPCQLAYKWSWLQLAGVCPLSRPPQAAVLVCINPLQGTLSAGVFTK